MLHFEAFHGRNPLKVGPDVLLEPVETGKSDGLGLIKSACSFPAPPSRGTWMKSSTLRGSGALSPLDFVVLGGVSSIQMNTGYDGSYPIISWARILRRFAPDSPRLILHKEWWIRLAAGQVLGGLNSPQKTCFMHYDRCCPFWLVSEYWSWDVPSCDLLTANALLLTCPLLTFSRQLVPCFGGKGFMKPSWHLPVVFV